MVVNYGTLFLSSELSVESGNDSDHAEWETYQTNVCGIYYGLM